MRKPKIDKVKDPKRVQTGKKAKRKGDSLERWAAKQLQDRYGDPHCASKDREFQRTPLSGGMKRSYPGDILVPDWFPFTIEAKARRDLDLAYAFPRILDQSTDSPLVRLWHSVSDNLLPATEPLLILKCWGCDPVVVMSDRAARELLLDTSPRIKIHIGEFLILIGLMWKTFLQTLKIRFCEFREQLKSEGLAPPPVTST